MIVKGGIKFKLEISMEIKDIVIGGYYLMKSGFVHQVHDIVHPWGEATARYFTFDKDGFQKNFWGTSDCSVKKFAEVAVRRVKRHGT